VRVGQNDDPNQLDPFLSEPMQTAKNLDDDIESALNRTDIPTPLGLTRGAQGKSRAMAGEEWRGAR
jgi:hypothetical protein